MQQQQPTVTEDEVDQTHCSVCSKHLRGGGVWWRSLVVLADDIPPQELTHTGSAPEHQSSGLSQLMGDLRIENVPPDSKASTYLRKLFSAKVPILKRVPKGARVNLACLYSEVIIDISKHPDEVSNWLKLMSIPAHCLKATDRGGKIHRTNLTSSVNSAIRSFSDTAEIPEQPKKKAKPKKETESLRRRVFREN